MKAMRCLGLDVGERRIGVAVSDETQSIAQPLEVLAAGSSAAAAVRALAALAAEHEVETIVVGLPLSLGGGDRGAAAARAREIGEGLRRTGAAKVVYLDERFSTAEAERLLIGAGVRRDKRRAVVDKLAAAIILQAYLDARRARSAEEE